MVDVRSTMKPLELLDLSRWKTVGEIVDGMSRCSFGARMLGEAAQTITDWTTREPDRSYVVFDGKPETPLSRLIIRMVDRRWFRGVVRPEAIFGAEVPNDALSGARIPEQSAKEYLELAGDVLYNVLVTLALPGLDAEVVPRVSENS